LWCRCRCARCNVNRLAHKKTAATAAAARRSVAGEAFLGHRLAWNARGVIADVKALKGLYVCRGLKSPRKTMSVQGLFAGTF
jgi:hypothetical protein